MTEREIGRELRRLRRSLFGCDGGNVCARLWVCGIEWGGELQALRDYPNRSYAVRIPTPLRIPYRTESDVPESWGRSQYDLRLAGLCLRLFHDWQPEQDPSCRKTYLLHRLYNRNSDIFKLNLYPYPCPNANAWDSVAKRLTRSKTKQHFRERCERDRFPLFRALLEQYKPKVVLCTGKSYREAFRTAFMGPPHEGLQDAPPLQGHLQIHRIEHTKVVIVPFRRLGSSLVDHIAPLLR